MTFKLMGFDDNRFGKKSVNVSLSGFVKFWHIESNLSI